MSRCYVFLMGALLAVIAGCTPQATYEALPVTAPPVVPSTVKEPWQLEWERVVNGAKEEGKLVITSSIAVALREALTEAMKRYGVELEFIIGRPPETAAKVLAEQRAGLYIADVHVGGLGPPTVILKPAGALEPLEPVLMLPEVLDPKAWVGGKLIWVDDEHYQIHFLAYTMPVLIANTELVKPGEVKSYRDLLNPRWKGKMVLMDPALGGIGANSFATVKNVLGLDYLRQLAKQDLVITQDSRLHVEWVARGSKAIAIWPRTEMVTEFKKVGAPIEPITPEEGVQLSAGTGGVALYRKAPHPNAAKLFINWLLTKEGGTVFSRAFGGQSARVDVPTDFLDPLVVRRPGVKYHYTLRHENAIEMDEAGPLSREIFGMK